MHRILMLSAALLIIGCSDAKPSVKLGTEGFLNEAGATELSVDLMLQGRSSCSVANGTKVRVLKIANDKVDILVLEGCAAGTNHTIGLEHVQFPSRRS